MKLGNKLHRNQLGDTLAAVSISLVVIGSVIAISYIFVSRIFRHNQQAKEREQIIKIVQSQIEGLKARTLINDFIFQDHPSLVSLNDAKNKHGDHRWFCIDGKTLIKYPTYSYTTAFGIGDVPEHLPQSGSANYNQFNKVINNENPGEDLNYGDPSNDPTVPDAGEDKNNNGMIDRNYSFAQLCGVDLASLGLEGTGLEIGIRKAETQTTGDPVFIVHAVWKAYTGGFDQITQQIGLVNIHQWQTGF